MTAADRPKPTHPDPHVDYGNLDLDHPVIANAVAEDHRRGIHHYGLACCEPRQESKP